MAKATKKPAYVEIKQEAEPEKYYGLGRFASYQAARDGLIPYVKVGRLLKALPHKIEAKLAGDD
jgi:hypothetical protein